MNAVATQKASRWALWLPLVLFAGFVGLVAWNLIHPASSDLPSRFVGQPLPQFNLPAAADGRPGLSRADMVSGKPKLLNVFASWCVPCAAESAQLAQIASAGVEVDGIAIRDHKADLAAFLARNGNPYARIGSDEVSAVQLAIGSSGVPESFVIDGKGVIRHQHIGVIMPDDVPKLLAKLQEAGR